MEPLRWKMILEYLSITSKTSDHSIPVINKNVPMRRFYGFYGCFPLTIRMPVEVKFFEREGKNYLVVGGEDDTSHFIDVLFINGTRLDTVLRYTQLR